MNNQAAQTMPSITTLPFVTVEQVQRYRAESLRVEAHRNELLNQVAALSQTAGVVLARGWFHALPDEDDYEFHDDASGAGKNCDGCIRAVIVAAPAASGGESHPNALPDGTLSKSTAKRLAAASVSERARELLAAQYDAEGWDTEANACRRGISDAVDRFALRALEQALTQQRGEAAAWLIRDERGRVVDAVESEAQRDRLLNTGYGQLPQWTAEPLYAGSAPIASAGTSWTHEDLKDLRERLVSAGISAHLNGDSNKASDRQFIRQAVTEAYGLIDDLLTTTPQPSADAVRELVKRWRAQADAHELNGLHACSVGLKQTADELDAKAKALRTAADELEAALTREAPTEAVGFTTGHCEYKKQPGGCPHHNLQCGYPSCDRRPATPPAPQQQSAEKECTCKAGEGCTDSCSRGWRRILSEAGQLPPSSRQSVLDFICHEMEKLGAPQRQSAKEVAIVCDWKDADPFPRFIEADVDGRSVSLEWRDREDGLRELIVPAHTQSDYPGCSGDPASCPENEGYGCCKPNPPRLAQGEAEAWKKIHVLTSVMEFRSLTEAERRELHECHLTIREATQPPHQDRGEEAEFKAWFDGEQGKAYDGMWQFARSAWMHRAALTEAKQQETDGPMDATDDADYLRHVAAKLTRLGYRIMGTVVDGIAIQYAAMAAKQQGPGEAVDLEQFRPAVEALERAGRTSEVRDGVLHWKLNEKHWEAQRLFAILDAPKVEAKRQTGENNG